MSSAKKAFVASAKGAFIQSAKLARGSSESETPGDLKFVETTADRFKTVHVVQFYFDSSSPSVELPAYIVCTSSNGTSKLYFSVAGTFFGATISIPCDELSCEPCPPTQDGSYRLWAFTLGADPINGYIETYPGSQCGDTNILVTTYNASGVELWTASLTAPCFSHAILFPCGSFSHSVTGKYKL